jgi:predicted esterase
MKLHKLGYSVLVISYPIGKQLGETEQEKQGQAAVRELVQVIRYLKEHEQELSVDMDDYAIFGFSAGGMMTTAYSFANYEDCCHKVKLPRPKVIFPMYGLDWNVKAVEQDKGLAVFSIAGREDEYGFGNIEKSLPQLKSVLGEDNVSVRVYDNLGHGFGIGSNTIVPHWFEEAVEFWEAHRK